MEAKEWLRRHHCEPSQASNREDKPIRERFKWRFLCPVENVREQSTLDRWSQ